MSSPQRRRRKRLENSPIIGRTELTAAAVVLAAAGITLMVVFLLSGGGDDGTTAGVQPTASAIESSAPFQATDANGEAILELARRSVEALPQGQWPALYDAFTQEFRDRCARAEFVSAGETDATNLGASLPQLHFKYLVNVELAASAASGVIVGALGEQEYTIETAYALEGGAWKIAPAPNTSGCNGFNRLSG
ncbi:MAG: hypothetical protein WD904_05205 [Dehalococcoidia bacterium]